jgi:murein DD-endopeptidase MepM/ murein hydrolase activator NlpD
MVAPIPGAEVIREFGLPGGQWRAGYHTGRDYRADVGTTVRATMAGDVVEVGYDDTYGLMVVLQTSGVRHLYGRLSEAAVKVSEQVEAGQCIGLSGEPHLHYEERVDPWGYADHRWPVFDTVGRDGPVRPARRR